LKIYSIIIVATISVTTLNAQNGRERIQNNVQVSQSKQALERDMKELGAFKQKIALFETAVNETNIEALADLQEEFIADMEREVDQLRSKKSAARREISQSSREVASERRELQDNREDSENGWGDYQDDQDDMARDRANKMDDQKDRMDDIKDALTLDKILENSEKVLAGFSSLDVNMIQDNPELMSKLSSLPGQFQKLLEADIQNTKKELEEDMKEKSEDRRETRDDIRERNEPTQRGGYQRR